MSKIELIQGDCLEKMKYIPDGSIDCIITDPPYGTTACKWDTCIPFEPMWEQLKRITKKNGAIVLFGSQPFTSALVMSNPKMFKYEWVWEKSKATGFFHTKFRPMKNIENLTVFSEGGCAVGSKMPMKYYPQDLMQLETPRKRTRKGLSATISNVVEPKGEQSETNHPKLLLKYASESGFHPTQKPVALMEYLIKTYTNEGETVLDFTMGSGTTGVACANTGRRFIGIERDEEYFRVASERISLANTESEVS